MYGNLRVATMGWGCLGHDTLRVLNQLLPVSGATSLQSRHRLVEAWPRDFGLEEPSNNRSVPLQIARDSSYSIGCQVHIHFEEVPLRIIGSQTFYHGR